MPEEHEIARSGSKEMTIAELTYLERLECRIRDALKNLVYESGESLREITELKLYRGRGYASIEQYADAEFGISRTHLHRLIAAAGVIKDVTRGLHIDPSGKEILPANERQSRELVSVPPANRSEVWCLVLERHQDTGDIITAPLIASVVKKWKKDRVQDTIEATYRVIDNGTPEEQPQIEEEHDENIAPEAPKKRGPYNSEGRNCRESDEFREASFKFFQLIERENYNNFRNVSKDVICRQLKGILLVLEG